MQKVLKASLTATKGKNTYFYANYQAAATPQLNISINSIIIVCNLLRNAYKSICSKIRSILRHVCCVLQGFVSDYELLIKAQPFRSHTYLKIEHNMLRNAYKSIRSKIRSIYAVQSSIYAPIRGK